MDLKSTFCVDYTGSVLQKLIYIVLMILCYKINNHLAMELEYKVQENENEGVFIGNIATDILLTSVTNCDSMAYKLMKEMDYVILRHESGELYTTKHRIDRETLCPVEFRGDPCVQEVNVVILCADQYLQMVKVKIVILDVNDNAPYFAEQVMNLSIPEDAAAGTSFGIDYYANDNDTGENSIKHYFLENSQNIFSLNDGETPSIVVHQPLDREVKDLYEMKIVAVDGGIPPLSGTATLLINIQDINDNCPVFNVSAFDIQIPENMSSNSVVTQLHAFDADLGPNAEISYSYGNRVQEISRKLFTLHSDTGLITFSGNKNPEISPIHKLTVLANGPGCAPAIIQITVSVMHSSKYSPKLEISYIANQADGVIYLKETAPENTPIALLEVTDPDHYIKGTIYISGSVPFYLKPYERSRNKHLIVTSQLLDHELENQYEIVIKAEDPHSLHELTIHVKITDENDNSPEFYQSSFEAFIEENNMPGAFLLKISATDADSGQNGKVTYHLGPDALPIFSIEQFTGNLIASTTLDREKDKLYRFSVSAVDHGVPPRKRSTIVIIHVLDQNDNTPSFLTNDYTFFIPENFPRHGEIGVINVTDLDEGANGNVTVSILNSSSHFLMDNTKGILRCNSSVDREKHTMHVFWVEAVDDGRSPLSSTAKITVFVLDINDNPPTVLLPQSNISWLLVPPNTPQGTAVAEIYAIDYDAGINAVMTYTIVGRNGPAPHAFGINTATGNITLQEKLLSKDYGLYQLLVKVSDLGQPQPLHSTVMVNLFVNETVSNKSYLEDLLHRRTVFTEEVQTEPNPCPLLQTLDIPCSPPIIPIAITMIIVSIIFFTISLCMLLSMRKKSKKKELYIDAKIPLKINLDYYTKDWNDEQL
ncbi:protocadherin-20-like [Stegostoma tigrinum]|uniref:protocadherin-20-like n=1 Tax=Stegostoma tigrinum TaxID=3053191 RepID=UPI00202B6079|nr:protocadherin-20-like [Stegostoma tigrinum]